MGCSDDPERHVPGLIDWIPYERIEDTIYIDLRQPLPIDFPELRERGRGSRTWRETWLRPPFQPARRDVRRPARPSDLRWIVRDIIYTLFLEAAGAGLPHDLHRRLRLHKRPRTPQRDPGLRLPKTRAAWDKFPNDEKTEPIISRLTPIAKNPRLRTIFGTPGAKLRIADIMDERSIFLVNIAGATEAGIILGTMILSQILQAGLRRSELPRHRRVPHHIYIDEFQNFQVGSDMAKILTQCRKYNLCMTVANQYTAQLPTGALAAVFGGTSTWFLFRLSPQDVPLFPKALSAIAYKGVYEQRDPNQDIPDYLAFIKDKDAKPETVLVDLKPLPFDPQILATLQVGECIHRKADATVQKVRTQPVGQRPHVSFANLIRQRTIEQYACPPRQPPAEDLESKRDDSGAKPFTTNEGQTRGPKRPR